jgi:hypothetical protein
LVEHVEDQDPCQGLENSYTHTSKWS